ncbi:MAG TPA: YgaP-like transmembrane domain [Polyangiaceae bacterium]|nr:YgaP-like transmembrane domain [Polyangiaceae bacterium]
MNVNQTERLVSTLLGGALVVYGLRPRTLRESALALLAGGTLVHRGVTGRCQLYRALGVNSEVDVPVARQLMPPPQAQATVTIGMAPQELYETWRDPEKLKQILGHIADVALTSAGLRWSMPGPMGKRLEWDAEIIEDRPGELLRWRSVPEAKVSSEGAVSFRKAPADWGTEVTVLLRFDPPGGVVGNALARLLTAPVDALVAAALRRFKSLVETGEIPSLAHNPSGRSERSHRLPLLPRATANAE